MNVVSTSIKPPHIQRFEYDESGRLVKIKTDAGVLLEEYTYGTSRQRLKKVVANGDKTYYAWGGSSVLVEYSEASSASALSWAKSYIYAGSRLLSTITKSGTSEVTEYHHPDRLGTKLITDTTANTAKEQATLPFGTSIDAETTGTSNQRFTSYDRSESTGLDYAVNRTYNSGQSRFTQVDPIGMDSASIGDPQSLNMYAYVKNNPIDFVDPTGLCVFGINILSETLEKSFNATLLARLFASEDVLAATRAEITRIFGAAGHSVTFDQTERADAGRFSLTYTNRNRGNSLGSTILGQQSGTLRAKSLFFLLLKTGHVAPDARGRAAGRIIAHEVVAHGLLGLKNGTGPGRHTSYGLTRDAFSSSDLGGEEGSSFLIPWVLLSQLNQFCDQTPIEIEETKISDKITPQPLLPVPPLLSPRGGGGGSDSFRSLSWLAFEAWANSGTVTVSYDETESEIIPTP